MRKHNLRLALMFSLLFFVILAISILGSLGVAILLLRLGLFSSNQTALLIGVAISSVIIGAVMGAKFSQQATAPIVEISEATKEVAKGNFNVRLEKKSHALEINEMAENFMLMAQELSGIETFRNDFISNVSHEFKTPLSAIEGYATLLQSPELTQEKREFYISKILYNTRRLSSLTGNILQLSRLENQEIYPQRELFSLDEQIRQTILMFEEGWTRKGLELDVDLDTVDYEGSPDLLAQVWQNLMGNAVKFTGEGGSIRVMLRKGLGEVKFYITDNGVGMSPEVQARVFEKFYQGDTSHTGTGNGLGLTLAKRIVSLHGGNITVASQEGKGTTFTVILPL